ncbi:MAG TPA: hypothetical protein VGL05_15590 [Kribbella sp.]
MRATYEDLLGIARRRAVEAYNLAVVDSADLTAGWQATLSATRHHMRWLRIELSAEDLTARGEVQGEGPLFALATSIGAAADLLASQNGNTSIVLDNRDGLIGARSDVAAIASMGARAALTRLASGQVEAGERTRRLYRHLVAVLAELEFLRRRGRQDIGPLARLATRLPKTPLDGSSSISHRASLWQRAHEATPPRELLSRDLRSTSAQLRTVAGYLTHVARLLHAAKGAKPEELRSLVTSLQNVTAAEARVSHAWRTRMSDVAGRSDSPVEPVFLQLLAGLQRWLRDGHQLKPAHFVIGDQAQAKQARAVVDELAGAAHQVAILQENAVRWLVGQGRLYVPKAELAKRDPEFNNRPTVWRLRYPQPYWVRTARASCFDELTSSVDVVRSSFAEAAVTSRRIAGTDDQHRPYGLDVGSIPHAVQKSPARWYQPVSDDAIPSIYAEPPGLIG